MELTISTIDPDYLPQWKTLPPEYRSRMRDQTVMFRMVAEWVEASKKLSQNKTHAERRRIADALLQDRSSPAREIGTLISRSIDQLDST